MRWRYRVVDEGQSPKDEAIKVLEEAKIDIESHCRMVHGDCSSKGGGIEEPALSRGPSHVRVVSAHIPKSWACEMSEVLQGLALARLIFNRERSEDGLISSLLKEALVLREDLRDISKMADTLNSIGMLRQKQRNYKDAEANFNKSLELRKQMGGHHNTEEEKSVAQAVAQSLTSLGDLFIEMADEMDPKGMEEGVSEERRNERKRAHKGHLTTALKHLEGAKEMYKKGFNDVHPKVAWALEGLAKAHQKNGEYREAQAAWEEAIAIRNQVQEASTGKQLFSAELEKAQKSKETLEEMRAEARGRMREGW